MKTKSDYAEIAQRLRPLIEFYQAYKPEVTEAHLFASDYAALTKNPKKAEKYGFVFHGKQITYMGFRLLNEAQNV